MTRDEFEAVIWQQLGAYATARIVDAILNAADSCATYTGGITAERRVALETAVHAGLRTVHFQVPCNVGHAGCTATARACNGCCWKQGHGVLTTPVVADVTCCKCQLTTPYLEALAGALEATG